MLESASAALTCDPSCCNEVVIRVEVQEATMREHRLIRTSGKNMGDEAHPLVDTHIPPGDEPRRCVRYGELRHRPNRQVQVLGRPVLRGEPELPSASCHAHRAMIHQLNIGAMHQRQRSHLIRKLVWCRLDVRPAAFHGPPMAGPVQLVEGHQSGRNLVVNPCHPVALWLQVEKRIPWGGDRRVDQMFGDVTASALGPLGDPAADDGLAGVDVDDADTVDWISPADIIEDLGKPRDVPQRTVHPNVLLVIYGNLHANLLDVGALPMGHRSCIRLSFHVASPLRHQYFEVVRIYSHDVLDGEVAPFAQLSERVALTTAHGSACEHDPWARLRVVARNGRADDVVLPLLPLLGVVVVIVVIAVSGCLAASTLSSVRAIEEIQTFQQIVGMCRLAEVVVRLDSKTLSCDERIDLHSQAVHHVAFQRHLTEILHGDARVQGHVPAGEQAFPKSMHFGFPEVVQTQVGSGFLETALGQEPWGIRAAVTLAAFGPGGRSEQR
mmetsp:Transcript_86517/g.218134  ORF Transcript_86517/g.218134 Transcript_86517/m.218134 type:complete len:496 (+) Transcript_86517:369-1856(+)